MLGFNDAAPGHKIYHATVGPQDAVVLPVGWILAERVQAKADIYGIRCSLLAVGDLPSFERWSKMWTTQGCPNSTLHSVVDTLTLMD